MPTVTKPDRITLLPGHVMDHILCYLPIREAVRTSVLSSKWRNKWYSLPDIVFSPRDPFVCESKYIKMVDHVLLLHSGSINMFKLSDSGHDVFSVNAATDMDRWILYLIGRSIKELVLDVLMDELYKIPWCLFSCQSLHRLKLYSCWLNPPTTFEGFRNLRSLDLDHIRMTQDAFENLISSCPLLEHLKLANVFGGVTQINIHAPNLKFFDIYDIFEGISFVNTFQLTTVAINLSLNLNSESNQNRLHGCSSNLLNFFDGLPHIQSLEIHQDFLKYLAAGVVPVKLPTPCINLGYLSLDIKFNDLKEVSAALCLLRSSPNLRTLEIFARIEKDTVLSTPTSYCWEDIFSRPTMPIKAQHVTIDGISDTKLELDFIRFLLLYLPMLEMMHVKPGANVTMELTKTLIQFKRASGRAKVIREDDTSSSEEDSIYGEERPNNEEVENEEVEVSPIVEKRQSKKPRWMKDYVCK
ncbi:F-box/FBD/LRR-repeat protein At1g13570-like [Vicia villosa]|uniref:F-box/FBD/LRR-repeat protein At1g13570-like n=1 Tax=Vicia villosa TaxID=3911 RepID=UPI00273AA129|nr:F-box/FBD/LRR-repeat protein At1g13570-like [Vicia villosa]XP_058724952.1 F-box/FBD/LRR-repeat protein At1g13570-like [Vicia villosa]